MLSEEVQKLISSHKQYVESRAPHIAEDTEKIHVDEIASKVATFYEKFRNLIQYHEAHLLRRDTIERILNRRVILRTSDGNFAEAIIKDLIRSGHLPNDSVSVKKIADVQLILDNLLYFLDHGNFANTKSGQDMSEWLIRIFVPLIEEELFPPPQNRLVGDMMYETIRTRLVLKGCIVDDGKMSTQLFIAVQRSLFRFDDDQLQYILLKFAYPRWGKMQKDELEQVVPALISLRAKGKEVMKNPLGRYFLKLCRKEKIAFQLAGDLLFANAPLEENYESRLRALYEERAEKISQQLKRLAFFSVLSFLISKIAVALAVEIPADRALSWPFSPVGMAINIMFPPLLMLAILAFMRPPSSKNFDRVAQEIKNILSSENQRKYTLQVPAKISMLSEFAVYVAYIFALFAVLYGIIRALVTFKFSPFSIAIFIIFTSMVIATCVKINNRAKEMSMEKEKATALGFIVDLVLVPFTALGRWIIAGLAKFNVVVILFDFLIELPLGFFLEFLENLRNFIRARKEEIE